jgi:SAM-dependent methyltransferase
MNILEQYVTTPPAKQHLLDLFQGEWSSMMPAGLGLTTTPGTAALFEDHRIVWAMETLRIPGGHRILELGPLEGGHSYMLHNAGAREIVAIEANTRAFLKCLCVKEIFDLSRAHYLLGDFVAYLEQDTSRYDAVIASGVLYHMPDPVALLELIAKVTGKVMLWTHYYDAAVLGANRKLAHKFETPHSFVRGGVTYEGSTQSYKDALNWVGFCGGSRPTSLWLTRDSLTRALTTFGFSRIDVAFDDPSHPNGPALAICAQKA